MIQQGIAYDWQRSRPLLPRKRKRKPAGETTTCKGRAYEGLWVGPISKNCFEWHFSIVGVADSAYADGVYHGRIVLPSDYPAKPPHIQMWTESGRFVPKEDICLSASAYHPESWKPSQWGISSLVQALRQHMASPSIGIGGMTRTYEERRAFALASRTWKCEIRPRRKNGQYDATVVIDHAAMIRQGLFPPPVSSTSSSINAKATDSKKGDDEEELNRDDVCDSGDEAADGTSSQRHDTASCTADDAGNDSIAPKSSRKKKSTGHNSKKKKKKIDSAEAPRHPRDEIAAAALQRQRQQSPISSSIAETLIATVVQTVQANPVLALVGLLSLFFWLNFG